MPLKSTLLTLISILMASCLWNPNRNYKELLSESEILGKWVLTKNSLEPDPFSFPLQNFKLLENGVIEFTDSLKINPRFNKYMDSSRVHDTKNGTWKLLHNSYGNSNILKKNLLEIRVLGGLKNFNFTKEKGKLIMWQYIGDPDSWNFHEYEKE